MIEPTQADIDLADEIAAAFGHGERERPWLAELIARARIEGAERMREAAVKAIKTDAGKCDCHARSEEECVCGAWDGYKTVQSSAMVEIVSALSPADVVKERT